MNNKFVKFNFIFIITSVLILSGGFLGYLVAFLVFFITYLFIKDKTVKIWFIVFLFLIFTRVAISDVYSKADIEVGNYENMGIKVIDHFGEKQYIVNLFYDDGKREDIKLILYSDDSYLIGDIINCDGKISKMSVYRNRGCFNYNEYLQNKGILGSIFITKIKDINYRPTKIDKIRQCYLNQVLESSKNVKLEYRGIYQKLLTGRSFLTTDGIAKYRKAGLAHILAISGLHIGILYLAFEYILKKLLVESFYRGVIEFFGIIFLWMVLGNQVTVLRTLIVLIVLIISKMFYLRTEFLNTISFSSFIILMINPYYIFDVGYQLTFIAMLGIGIYNKILRPKIKHKKIGDFILMPICIQLMIFPILICNFQEMHYWTLLFNILITPFFSILIVLVYLALVISNIQVLSFVIFNIINGILYYNDLIIDVFDSVFVLENTVQSFTLIEIVYYYIIIALVIYVIKNEIYSVDYRYIISLNWKKHFVFLILCVICWCLVLGFRDETIEINILDVGQGDCISLNYKSHHYLIDSGGNGKKTNRIYEWVLKPYLYSNHKLPIEGCFISHLDYDHYGGINEALGKIPIDRIYLTKQTQKLKVQNELVLKAKENSVLPWFTRINHGISFNKYSSLEVVAPNKTYLSENDNSMIMSLKAYGKTILFTGDMGFAEEEEVIRMLQGRKIDILKIAHHGSATSTSDYFLDHLNPDIAFISVGENNAYGHPSNELIDRLEARNIKIYRTDKSGEITLFINPKYCIIDTYARDKKVEIGMIYLGILIYLVLLGIGVSECTIKNI